MSETKWVLKINGNNYNIRPGYIFSIGKKTDTFSHDIELDEKSVNCKHAAIDFRTTKITVIDLISTSGTYKDNIKLDTLVAYDLTKSCTLKFGDVIGELIIQEMFLSGSEEKNIISSILNITPSPDINVSRKYDQSCSNKVQSVTSNTNKNETLGMESKIDNSYEDTSSFNNILNCRDSLISNNNSINDEFIPETQEIIIDNVQESNSQQFRMCTQEFDYLSDNSIHSNSECLLPLADDSSVFNSNDINSIAITDGNKKNETESLNNFDSNIKIDDVIVTNPANVRKRLSTIPSVSESLDSDSETINNSLSPVVRKSNRFTDSTDDELDFDRYITMRKKISNRNYVCESTDEDMIEKSPTKSASSSPKNFLQDNTSTPVVLKIPETITDFDLSNVEGNKENNNIEETIDDSLKNKRNCSSIISESKIDEENGTVENLIVNPRKAVKRKANCNEKSVPQHLSLEKNNIDIYCSESIVSENLIAEEIKTKNNKKDRLVNASDPGNSTRFNRLPINSIKNKKNYLSAKSQCKDDDFAVDNSKQRNLRKTRGALTKLSKSNGRTLRSNSRTLNSTGFSQASSSILSGSNLIIDMSLRKKLKIIFSQIDPKEEFIDNLRSLGIQIVTDPKQAEILVTEKIKRTYKLLIAIVRGIPIVSIKWLEQSISKNVLMPHDKFYIKDVASEKQFIFDLSASLKLAQDKKIFEGYNFLLTKNIKPLPKEMKDLIECGGGRILRNTTSARNGDKENVFLVSDIKDKTSWIKFQNNFNKLQIIEYEGILISILRQSVQFENYFLK